MGDTFLKIDSDERRIDGEVEALRTAPVPTPQILWRKPPVLALADQPLGRLGEPSNASPTAWAAVGEVIRTLHDAPLPSRPATSVDELGSRLADECRRLVEHAVLPLEIVERNQ